MLPEWLNKKRGKERIVYLAHPTRMRGMGKRFVAHARSLGMAPVNPFDCGEYQDFEGGVVGREDTIGFTLGLQRLCPGGTNLYGISDGTMRELVDRLKWDSGKKIRIFREDENGHSYDDRWDEEYAKLAPIHGDALSDLRGKNKLIALVGPDGIKTELINALQNHFGKNLERVKTVTTRKSRLDSKENHYLFTHEQFLDAMTNRCFLEYDKHLKDYFACSLDEIKNVLCSAHGILSITPKGAEALYRCRYEINVNFVLLKPESDAVLKKSLENRGITNEEEQTVYIEKAREFVLPSQTPHRVLKITGTASDRERLLDLAMLLLK